MAGAAQQADAQAVEAPFGYTRDPVSGEMRPKKSPGRPKRSPSVDDLKAPPSPPVFAEGSGDEEAGAAGELPAPPPAPAADRAPDDTRKPAKGRGRAVPEAPVPPYRAGVIAAGVNR